MNHVRCTLALSGLLLLFTVAGAATPPSGASAEIDAVTRLWIDAFNRKSVEGILALYAPDAVLLGTSSPVLRDRPALVREYFANLPNLGDSTISLGERRVHVHGDIATSSGFYTRVATEGGRKVENPARFTFVYQRRDGRWLILTHHSSALPAAPSP